MNCGFVDAYKSFSQTLHCRIMAPRIQLEKAAWRWVETVKPEEIKQEHIELAYRVNLSACKRGTCRYDISISEEPSSVVLVWASEKYYFCISISQGFNSQCYSELRCIKRDKVIHFLVCELTLDLDVRHWLLSISTYKMSVISTVLCSKHHDIEPYIAVLHLFFFINKSNFKWCECRFCSKVLAAQLSNVIVKDTFCFCRRNCKGNPNCLVGIGEQAWLGEIDENAFHNIDDPNSERRDKVLFSCLYIQEPIALFPYIVNVL